MSSVAHALDPRSFEEGDKCVDIAVQLGEELINMILERQPREKVEELVDSGAPLWYQNECEGISPLHAAAYSEDVSLVQYLLHKGALWNACDYYKNTAGDIALSFNNEEMYGIIRNAGIQAELLLSIMSKSMRDSPDPDSALILRSSDNSALGSTEAFLTSPLVFKKDAYGQDICMLNVDGEEIGVMMGWEEDIMKITAEKLCKDHPQASQLRVLNVGFGLGIIDGLFQSLPDIPISHVIIEPHPDIQMHMKDNGWYQKPGVKILEGKWQDFIESDELLGGGGFDVVFTDTFAEDYSTLHDFFKHLPVLLRGSDSRFSFFNGLGATNALYYDVYTKVSDFHLNDVGLDVQWTDVNVGPDTGDRWGDTRQYFSLPIYRLPVATMNRKIKCI